jgi:hypothetical protein
MSDLIIVGDEAWTEAELRRALKQAHCRICHGCNHRRVVSDEEVTQIRRRYQWNGLPGPAAKSNVHELAAEYGVTPRTIHRWVSGEFRLRKEEIA